MIPHASDYVYKHYPQSHIANSTDPEEQLKAIVPTHESLFLTLLTASHPSNFHPYEDKIGWVVASLPLFASHAASEVFWSESFGEDRKTLMSKLGIKASTRDELVSLRDSNAVLETMPRGSMQVYQERKGLSPMGYGQGFKLNL